MPYAMNGDFMPQSRFTEGSLCQGDKQPWFLNKTTQLFSICTYVISRMLRAL